MSYSVVRLQRELAARSRIGVIGVQRMGTAQTGDWNRVVGLDGRIGIRDAWTIDWWGAASATPGPDGDAAAYSARLGYETGSWSNLARIIQVGRGFDPQVGFLNRGGGYRFYEGTVMWKKRFPGVPWLKDWHPHVGYRGYYGLDGYWQEGRIHLDITEVSLANGAMIGPEVNIEHQGLQQPFAIASNVTLPVGSYDYTSLGLDFGTNPSARLELPHDITPGRVQRRAPGPGHLYPHADCRAHRLVLHAPRAAPDAGPVQQSGPHLDGERAVRLARHGGHGIVRRLQ